MAITQVGSQVTVSFNNITYSDFQMEDSSGAITGDIDEIRNDDNDMVTKLITNKGHRYRLTGVVKDVNNDSAELTALRAIVKGSTLAVNGTSCMVEDIEISYNRLATRATITVIDDAITYS